jgi:23S rRNA (pseudouridine1915-N3)-methyltransferase
VRLYILAVGGVREPGLRASCELYERRARRYFQLAIRELEPAGKGGSGPGREAEGNRILEAVPDGCDLLALTRSGKGMTSRRLARYLEELGTYGGAGAAFAIGSADGLSDGVLEAARYRLALSPMTLSHELARLVLLEQLYRAGTIIRGEPYHRGP